MEREAEMADAAIANRGFGLFQQIKFQDDFVPSAFAQGVEQIEIRMVSLELAQLLVQHPVKIGFFFN